MSFWIRSVPAVEAATAVRSTTRNPSLPGVFLLLFIAGSSLDLVQPSSNQASPSIPQDRAREIMDRVDQMMRGESSTGTVRMKVATRRWNRSMTLRIWSQGTDKALIRILAPRKNRGTATLRVGSNMWNYLSKIERVIRVPMSMMMGAWMGSHLTNDDLVKESRLVRDYDIRISFEGEREGTPVWDFELVPKPEAAVVWGRIVYRVRQADLLPVWARYYGEDEALKRTMSFSDYAVMGGRRIPTRMSIVPEDKQGEFTEMVYEDLSFDVPLAEKTFSLSNLRARR